MNDKLYKKLSEDFIKRGEILLNDCDVIEDENNILYILKKKDNNWFFNSYRKSMLQYTVNTLLNNLKLNQLQRINRYNYKKSYHFALRSNNIIF